MKCKTFNKSTNKVCIKDKKKIQIRRRKISSQGIGDFNTQVAFETLLTTSAFIKTRSGTKSLDGINISDVTTVDFIIQYTPTLANYIADQLSILYEDNIYSVDRIENIDLQNKNLILSCIIRGDDNKQVNYLR